MKSISFQKSLIPPVLEDRKTMTRRIVKPQPDLIYCGEPNLRSGGHVLKGIRCPYGQPGDHLIVREEHYRFGHWEAVPGVKTKGGRQKWRFVAYSDEVLFDAPESFRKSRHRKDPHTPAWHKRLARFMPHSLARITLEIVSVRVERLQEISEEDALAEGIEYRELSDTYHANGKLFTTARAAFAELWESINGPGSWAANEWVWVVEFKRVEGGAE